jgi:hypothetical protein
MARSATLCQLMFANLSKRSSPVMLHHAQPLVGADYIWKEEAARMRAGAMIGRSARAGGYPGVRVTLQTQTSLARPS